jgi:large conductance mechanosensitive channel protein
MDQKQLVNKEDLKNEFEAYKKFAFKGDMLKMAIAFILGGAFNKVVGSISENILMPFLNFVISKTPGESWREAVWSPIEGMSFEIGKFAATTVDFILITIVLFVLFRILQGQMEDEEVIERRPLLERAKDFVLGDWFFAFAAIFAIVVMIFSQSWMAGIWSFVGMSLAVSWFQNRELKQKWSHQEKRLQKTEENKLP